MGAGEAPRARDAIPAARVGAARAACARVARAHQLRVLADVGGRVAAATRYSSASHPTNAIFKDCFPQGVRALVAGGIGRCGVVVGQRLAKIMAEARDRATGRAPEPRRRRAAEAGRVAGADAVGRRPVAAETALKAAPGGESVGRGAVGVAPGPGLVAPLAPARPAGGVKAGARARDHRRRAA